MYGKKPKKMKMGGSPTRMVPDPVIEALNPGKSIDVTKMAKGGYMDEKAVMRMMCGGYGDSKKGK
jgi:hypothetical protein